MSKVPSLREQRGLVSRIFARMGKMIGRKPAEQRIWEHQRELARASQLSAMAEVASAITHELSQPLCGIIMSTGGCLQMMNSGSADRQEILQAMELVADQAKRAGEIVHQIRHRLRRREPACSPVDLNDLVGQALTITGSDVRVHGLAMRVELGEQLPLVQADPIQIQQVIVNLVQNAIEAMNHRPVREREVCIRIAQSGAAEVEVAVCDTGEGLAEDVLERIFEPFFTTRPDGMGMGLPISRSIIQAHGGRLWATPHPDGGATFHFTLPVANGGHHDDA